MNPTGRPLAHYAREVSPHAPIRNSAEERRLAVAYCRRRNTPEQLGDVLDALGAGGGGVTVTDRCPRCQRDTTHAVYRRGRTTVWRCRRCSRWMRLRESA